MRSAQSGRSAWWMDQVELGQRFGLGASVVAELRRCCGGRIEERPPARRCQSRLESGCAWRWSSPAPCRGDGQLQSRPEVDMARTRRRHLKALPFAADSSSARSAVVASRTRVGVAGRSDETLLGSQDPGGGKQLHLNPQPAWLDVDHLERHAQPDRRLDVGLGQISVAELLQPLRHHRMHSREPTSRSR